MKKSPLRHKIIKDDVFEATVILFWGGDFHCVNNYMVKNYGINFDEGLLSDKYSFGFVSERLADDLNGWAFWVGDTKDVSTLVHECIHLIYRIFEYKSIDIKTSEEVVAFYAGYWFKRIQAIVG